MAERPFFRLSSQHAFDDVQYPAMWLHIPILTALLVASCSSTELDLQLGTCEQMAAKYIECIAPEMDIEALSQRCEKYQVDYKALQPCGVEVSCSAFQRCLETYRTHADPDRRRRRVQDYIEARNLAESEGRFLDAQDACKKLALDPDPGEAELTQCDGLPKRAYDASRAKLRLLRDLPRARFGHLSLCETTRSWAIQISPEAVAEAAQLCREAEASIETVELVLDVKRRAQQNDLRVPTHCENVAKQLDELDSEWGSRLKAVVLKECYLKLGSAILQARKRRSCSVNVRRILAAAKRHPVIIGEALQKSFRDDFLTAQGECAR